MCGFCGYINKKEKTKEEIKKMTDLIAHRGPDDENYYMDDFISMGFRRLSIIDLKNGRQPMEYEDYVITYNGEIYNFKDIKEDLIKKGHMFKTNSDTEVLLHGYIEYKEKILDLLRGMFAFVIWDKKNKTLFGARDHFGQKPFYYTNMNNTFMYGSEIKSFLYNKDFIKEINKNSLKPFLTFQTSVLEETFFKGVYKLLPGHYFNYDLETNKIDIKKYYQIKFEEEKQDLMNKWLNSVK